MTKDNSWTTPPKKAIGDVAVDGLLSGMAAGVVMAGVLIAVGLLNGVGVAETLGGLDPGSTASPVTGALLHMAVAGLYGVAFALAVRLLPRGGRRVGWLLGAAYGLVLWLAAQLVVLPGLNAGLDRVAPWQFALAHVAYGAVLGYLLARHALANP